MIHFDEIDQSIYNNKCLPDHHHSICIVNFNHIKEFRMILNLICLDIMLLIVNNQALVTMSCSKTQPQIFPWRVLVIFYPIFCFQQAFWLNIRQSMSPLNNIYISRRIFLHWKLKNRVKIKESVKIKNWRRKFFGFFFHFLWFKWYKIPK